MSDHRHLISNHNLTLFSSSKCCFVLIIAAAAMAPLAAVLGTPIPGLVLSPHRKRFFNGVVCPGKPFPAIKAAPYVPWYLGE